MNDSYFMLIFYTAFLDFQTLEPSTPNQVRDWVGRVVKHYSLEVILDLGYD